MLNLLSYIRKSCKKKKKTKKQKKQKQKQKQNTYTFLVWEGKITTWYLCRSRLFN
jgi:hypothetical protein